MESIQYASTVCTILSSLLSIFGAIVIFWTYWRVTAVRNFPRTLLTWLTIADFLIASGNLSGSIEFLSTNGTEKNVCNVQSFVTTFASMASFFWTLVITVHMMVSIQCRSEATRSVALKVMYHVICWGVPGVITLEAGLENFLGSTNQTNTSVTGSWCWINDKHTDTERIEWMLITGKGWEILCYILSLSILVLLKLRLFISRRRLSELNADFRDEDVHYLYLWLVLWLLRVWGTIRFLLFWFMKNDGKDFLILHSIGDSGQAFGNCILFCFLDRDVRGYIRRACISCHFRGAEYQRLITSAEVSANSDNKSNVDAV